jgi:outer membrane receptor for ferrienterochelin and colicin
MTFDVGKNKNWHSLLAIHTAQPAKRIDRNDDNFMDLPLLTRDMAYNKWEYNTGKPTGLTTQLGWRLVNEGRIGGQLNYEEKANQGSSTIYGQSVKFTQPEFFVKSGYRFSDKHALTSSFSGFYHDQHSWFGNALFKANQLSFYLHIQHKWAWSNNNLFKYGTSYRYQKLKENISFANSTETRTYSGIYHTNLNVPGFFIENTFSGLDDKLTLITGLRVDKHQKWGWYTTPRMMGKFTFNPHHTLRASVGKGWRQVNLFSEQVTLLASSRDIIFTEKLKPETATTWGLSHTWNFRLGGGNFTLSGDFYQTAFRNQFFPDYDSDPTKAFIANFEGKTRSNSLQIDALASFLAVWEIRMAYNYLNVYRLEDGIENSLLFNPRNRVMTTISFRLNDKWQFDMNGHWHDHMRLPDTRRNPVPYQRPLYSKPYALLSLQGTYKLDKADIYVGSENINGFRQDRPIISTDNPFGQYFDLSSVWGPIRGREFYVGIRFKISR